MLLSHRKEGHKPYVIPAGGSSTLGAWGYIDGFDEMMKQVIKLLALIQSAAWRLSLQGVLEDFDDIVLAAGSVGTACGLAVAKHLTGASIK